MKAIVLLVSLAALAACRSSSSNPSVPTPLRTTGGDYRFNEMPLGTTQPLEGTISVHGDEVAVDLRDAACADQPTNDPRTQSFRCGIYNIRATKLNGAWEFSYATKRDVENRRTICDAYGKTPGGTTICTAQHSEVSMSSVPVTGHIRLFALETASLKP